MCPQFARFWITSLQFVELKSLSAVVTADEASNPAEERRQGVRSGNFSYKGARASLRISFQRLGYDALGAVVTVRRTGEEIGEGGSGQSQPQEGEPSVQRARTVCVRLTLFLLCP
ncbi:hypothetical protein MLD38_036076 [Melastoma candidum]|uniref:Uncharacterized protein n=1 Tax=Melastoma candidum TaxID=119954 RepID=A0ACB9LIU7_9MYRT|nr:hypothetical protein MLD38_036076 [Melastoma candidum]